MSEEILRAITIHEQPHEHRICCACIWYSPARCTNDRSWRIDNSFVPADAAACEEFNPIELFDHADHLSTKAEENTMIENEEAQNEQEHEEEATLAEAEPETPDRCDQCFWQKLDGKCVHPKSLYYGQPVHTACDLFTRDC